MRELIERLEKATGRDRLLDRDIGMRALGWKAFSRKVAPGVMLQRLIIDGDEYADHPGGEYPAFTESVDAALTLVPEDWALDIWMRRHGGHHWSATLHIPSYQQDGQHKELPIAICIAALRARTARELVANETS